MSKKEIFDFLSENLRIVIESKDYYDDGGSTRYTVKLLLKNPETDKEEDLSCGDNSFSIYHHRD